MNRLDRALQLAAALGLVLVVLPLAVPHSTRASAVVQDFVHVPVFALVAIAALRTLQAHRSSWARSKSTQYLIALAGAAGIGAASEIAQIPGPRDASLQDWIVDVVSATTALALMHRHESRGPEAVRRRLALTAASIVCLLFLLAPLVETAIAYGYRYQQMPDLVRFHGAALDSIDTYFLADNPAHPLFQYLPEKWRKPDDPVGMRVLLPPVQWPGLRVSEPFPDWRGFSSLQIDLTNPGNLPLELTLRIHDAEHQNRYADRFNQRITLPPQARETVTIPLATVRSAPQGRQMDMAHIAGVLLFRTGPERDDEVYVTRIALEK